MTTEASPELVIVMPIYNEAANISNVISEWLSVLDKTAVRAEILAINDGSKDSTLEILEGLKKARPREITVVDKPNSGHGGSCRYGYDLALKGAAPWIMQIDSDGQCNPEYFPAFWAAREDADCVFGVRTSRGDGFMRKVISKICSTLSSLVASVNVKDANVPYRMMRKTALAQALPKIPASIDLQNIALTVALKRCPDLRWKYVPIHFRDRQGGINSINLPKIAKMGLKMLSELRLVEK